MKGNHDYWWSTRKKVKDFFNQNSLKSIQIMHNSAHKVGNCAICGTRGWNINPKNKEDVKIISRELIRLEISLNLAINTGLEPIVFFNFPPIFAEEVSDQIIDILLRKKVKKCFYGHIHSRETKNRAFTGAFKGINFQILSADIINFDPIKIN